MPKRYNPENFNPKNTISAYLLINIIKINKKRKFSVVRDLSIGRRYVDLITLEDLVNYHEIEYEIIDGFYYDNDFIKIDSRINEIYNQRIEAKNNKDFEKADLLKKTLNIKLYGNSLKHKKINKIEKFENFEEAFEYMIKHKNVEKMTHKKILIFYLLRRDGLIVII